MSRSEVWMIYWCCLVSGNREILCTNGVSKGSNVSVELLSDVLLPCNFDPALLGSDMTADISVVWKQINTTVHGLLEITLQGEARFWDSKERRIKPFPDLSESGNFSILLRKVQPFDLSLYRCELFNGTSCSIAYQEIQLGLPYISYQVKMLITGASIGAVLLCLFITSVFYLGKKLLDSNDYNTISQTVQLDVAGKPRPHPESSHDNCSYPNPIYASYQNPVQLSHIVDAHTHENPIYETAQNSRGSRR